MDRVEGGYRLPAPMVCTILMSCSFDLRLGKGEGLQRLSVCMYYKIWLSELWKITSNAWLKKKKKHPARGDRLFVCSSLAFYLSWRVRWFVLFCIEMSQNCPRNHDGLLGQGQVQTTKLWRNCETTGRADPRTGNVKWQSCLLYKVTLNTCTSLI